MTGNVADCPATEMLERLGGDSLSADSFGTIEAHIQNCLRCQAALERLSTDEPDPDEDAPRIPGFTIERLLGRGGMGIVYQAWQPELARHVAIKLLTRSPANKRRWLREARAMARIRHPHAVRLHQVGESARRFYLVMDLIPGGSLKERMGGPIRPRHAASLIERVARAAGHIHASGVLHLDIKPSNILLEGQLDSSLDDVVPVLADFGLARALDREPGDRSHSTGALQAPRGTPAYMAPEQVDGRDDLYCPQTDVFALGCTLYALLTGLSPFEGASVVETIDRVRTHEPVPPRRLLPDLSRDLETIVLRALRKEISARYASATELADDLRRWLDGLPVRARPMGLWQRSRRWCARRPAIAALLALFVGTVAISLLSLSLLWRRAAVERTRAEAALHRSLQSQADAARSRAELIGLLVQTFPDYVTLSPQRANELVDAFASQASRLCDEPELTLAEVTQLLQLIPRLVDIFVYNGKRDSALAFSKNGLRMAQHYDRPGARAPELTRAHQRLLFRVAQQAAELDRYDEACDHIEQAVLIGRDSGNVESCAMALAGAYQQCRFIIERALEGGDPLLARHAQGMFATMAKNCSEAFPEQPLLHILSLASFPVPKDELDSGGPSSSRDWDHTLRSIRCDERETEAFCEVVAVLFTMEAIAQDLISKDKDERAPADHAAQIFEAIDRLSRVYRFSNKIKAECLERIFGRLIAITTRHRQQGRIDRAESVARTLLTLSKSLCSADPQVPAYHIDLAHALEQGYKNACRRNDRDLARRYLRAAFMEATAAAALSPDDSQIQRAVASLHKKVSAWEIGRTGDRDRRYAGSPAGIEP